MFNVSQSDYLYKHNIRHYESGFEVKKLPLNKLRECAFSPTVYRIPTDEELIKIFTKRGLELHKSDEDLDQYVATRLKFHVGGYRAYRFAIGLTDSGYVDLDDCDTSLLGEIPTIDNVTAAMRDHGLYHIVFQSASKKPGKLRLIYKRAFQLYYEGCYNPTTQTWNYTPPTTKTIHSTNDDVCNPKEFNTTSITMIIESILYQETMQISKVLAEAGINTSGIDATACRAHMHSAHSIAPNIEYSKPQWYLEGEAI